MTQKHKNIRIAGAVVFGVLLVWGIIALARKKEPEALPVVPDITLTEKPNTDTVKRPVKSPVKPATLVLSYDEALEQYADKRMQFDRTCQATPNAPTFKSGTRIMLDNRSAEARTLRIGTLRTVSIPAWGFTTIELSSNTVPAMLDIDCGVGENVAVITVQK